MEIADIGGQAVYVSLRELGSGAFGVAVLCQCDARSLHGGQEHVVLKRIDLKKTFRSEEEFTAMRNEMSVLEQLQHGNIVRYFRAFRDAQDWFNLVLEYCDGGDLGQFIHTRARANDPLPEAEIKELLRQILSGVHHLHGKKVLHRDLKPKNIFLTANRTVKIGDFGISKMLESTNALAQTTVGTPYYMAPELYEQSPYNAKSDIWAIGCIAYELAALVPPFKAPNAAQLMVKVVQGTYTPLGSNWSASFRSIVERMMSQDAQQRPTAAELLSSEYFAQSPQAATVAKEERQPQYTKVKRMGPCTFGESVLCRNNKANGDLAVLRRLDASVCSEANMNRRVLIAEVNTMKIALGKAACRYIMPYDQAILSPSDHIMLVTPYLSRGTLRAFLAQRRQQGLLLPERCLLYWTRQLLLALSTLHEQGFPHGRLHTGNVFLSDASDMCTGHMRLKSVPDLVVQRHSAVMENYLAPEDPLDCPQASAASDIWALGCIVAEMATLSQLNTQKPPKDQAPKRAAVAHSSVLRVGYPTSVARLVEWLLTPDPSARPTAVDVLMRSPDGCLSSASIPFASGNAPSLLAESSPAGGSASSPKSGHASPIGGSSSPRSAARTPPASSIMRGSVTPPPAVVGRQPSPILNRNVSPGLSPQRVGAAGNVGGGASPSGSPSSVVRPRERARSDLIVGAKRSSMVPSPPPTGGSPEAGKAGLDFEYSPGSPGTPASARLAQQGYGTGGTRTRAESARNLLAQQTQRVRDICASGAGVRPPSISPTRSPIVPLPGAAPKPRTSPGGTPPPPPKRISSRSPPLAGSPANTPSTAAPASAPSKSSFDLAPSIKPVGTEETQRRLSTVRSHVHGQVEARRQAMRVTPPPLR